MTAHYDSILFDFDGVLADTESIHWECWREILAPLEIELTWDLYRANCIGVEDRAMVAYLASLARRPVVFDPVYERKQELFRQRMLEVNPCAAETVELLRSLGAYRLAVVTSSARTEVEPVLERAGIRGWLSAMVFGEDVEHRKPAPDPYLLAAARLDATHPLVVEDSDAGVASARAAGFDVIRVSGSAEVPRLVTSRLLTGACDRG